METPKIFFIFWETETSKKLFMFQETELSYISGNGKPKKTSYISGSNISSSKNEKKNLKMFLIFQEMGLYSTKKFNKTPLGETGCLSSHQTLLVAQASSF